MLSLPPLPLIDGCLFVDNSGWMESIATCHRMVEYKQLHRRIASGERPALNFGSAMHLALEYRYIRAANSRTEPWIDDEVGAILAEYFLEHPTPDGDFRTLNWATEVFRRYNERYAIEDFNLLKYSSPIPCPYCEGKGHATVLDSSGGRVIPCVWCNETGKRDLMVEMPFVLPLFTYLPGAWSNRHAKLPASIPVFYTGKIDLPISLDGEVFILDHKTTSLLGPSFFDRMRRSAQQRGYCWAFQQLTAQIVSGYVVNALRTKEPPLYVTEGKTSRAGKSQSPESWWADSLQRERFYLTPTDLDEWKTTTISRLEEFFFHYQRGYMPDNAESCTKYGRCSYYDVCTLTAEDRGIMLSSGAFTTNDWSPLKQPQTKN
jgi:hypothetical protein